MNPNLHVPKEKYVDIALEPIDSRVGHGVLATVERVERINTSREHGVGSGVYVQLAELSNGRTVPFCAKLMDGIITEGLLVIDFADNLRIPPNIKERVNIIEAGCMKGDLLRQGGILPLLLFPEVTDNIVFDEATGKDILLVHSKDANGRMVVSGGEVVGQDCTALLGLTLGKFCRVTGGRYAGVSPTFEELPKTGENKGDVWLVESTNTDYVFDGEKWEALDYSAVDGNAQSVDNDLRREREELSKLTK